MAGTNLMLCSMPLTQTLMQPYSQLRSLKNRPLSSILFLANAQTKTGVAIHGSGNPDVCVQRGQSQQAARVNDTFGVTRKIYGLTVFDTATSIKEKGEPGASDNTEAAGELGDSSMDVDSGYESFDDTGHSSPQGDFPSPGAAAMHGASSAEASHVSAPAPDFLDLPLHGRLVKDLAVFTTLNGFTTLYRTLKGPLPLHLRTAASSSLWWLSTRQPCQAAAWGT